MRSWFPKLALIALALTLVMPATSNAWWFFHGRGGGNITPIITTPTVVSVGPSSPASGYFDASKVITFPITFSQAVTVATVSDIRINLNSGATQATCTVTNATTLGCSYTVGSSDNANPLATTSSAIALDGATIVGTSGGLTASLTGANSQTLTGVIVDTTAPTVLSVVATGAGITSGNGTITTAGVVIQLQVNFGPTSSPSSVTTSASPPTLSLNNGGTATCTNCTPGTYTPNLDFNYTTTSGQNTPGSPLVVTAFNLPSGNTIQDQAGNNAVRTGAVPGLTGNIAINIGGTANGTVILAGSTNSITDSTGVTWTITSTSCLSGSTAPCIAANGTVVGGSEVVEMAYVNSVVWQLNTSGNWYAITGPTFTTVAGPTTQSPLTSPNNSSVTAVATITNSVNSPAIVDSLFNNWTITNTGCFSTTPCMAVNGITITPLGADITELAYVSGVVWQFGNGLWYPVATVNGAATTFGSGTATSPLPNNPTVFGGCCLTGPSASNDVSWNSMVTLMGRPGGSVMLYNGYGNETTWTNFASSVLSNGAGGMGGDTNFSPSKVVPMIAWAMGDQGSDGVNYFARMSAASPSADDCYAQQTIALFNSAGYHTLVIRPGWEMNGQGWYGWQLNTGNYTQFLAAWSHFYTMVHNFAAGHGVSCAGITVGGGSVTAAQATNASPTMNIQIAFNPNVGFPISGLTLSQWVPPASQIDIYAIDDYGSNLASAPDLNSWFALTMVAYAKANGKPIGGGEIGGLTAAFAQAYVSFLNTVGVPIAFWDWWNVPAPNGASPSSGPQASTSSWTQTTDTDCLTPGTATSGVGGNDACGATSGAPTPGTVAYYWWQGFNALSGTVAGNQ